MTAGYVEFEFDLPEALLKRLITVFDNLSPAPLTKLNVEAIPEEQGVYQIFLTENGKSDLVYIGKTDAASGLRVRLNRHAIKIQNRQNLDPDKVTFKAVRVFVFTPVDLETQLIEHYGTTSTVSWNGSGFGSNDPGRERDTTTYKENHFDARFPIDINRPLSFAVPSTESAANILRVLKAGSTYLIRFQRLGKGQRAAHLDLEKTSVSLDPSLPKTAESVIKQVIQQLPVGWHATMLPSHVIIYKEDNRQFPSGRLIAKS